MTLSGLLSTLLSLIIAVTSAFGLSIGGGTSEGADPGPAGSSSVSTQQVSEVLAPMSSALGDTGGFGDIGEILDGVMGSVPDELGPVDATLQSQQGQLVASLNDYRADRGLYGLERSARLDADSQVWAEHIATTGVFEHDYDANVWENLAIIVGEDVTWAVEDGWHNSPGHQANMVNQRVTHTGHGVARMQHGPYEGQLVIVQRMDVRA